MSKFHCEQHNEGAKVVPVGRGIIKDQKLKLRFKALEFKKGGR
jgi:hypothetical protein